MQTSQCVLEGVVLVLIGPEPPDVLPSFGAWCSELSSWSLLKGEPLYNSWKLNDLVTTNGGVTKSANVRYKTTLLDL